MVEIEVGDKGEISHGRSWTSTKYDTENSNNDPEFSIPYKIENQKQLTECVSKFIHDHPDAKVILHKHPVELVKIREHNYTYDWKESKVLSKEEVSRTLINAKLELGLPSIALDEISHINKKFEKEVEDMKKDGISPHEWAKLQKDVKDAHKKIVME